MNIWLLFWIILAAFSLVSFGVLAVLVTVYGYENIKEILNGSK